MIARQMTGIVVAAIACAMSQPQVALSQERTTPVKSPTLSNTVQLWTTDQVVDFHNYVEADVSCAGYSSLRVVLNSDCASNLENLRLGIYLQGPTGAWSNIAQGNFVISVQSVVLGANFASIAGTASFVIPVMSDVTRIRVQNETGNSVTMYGASCWAYLVN